MKWTTLDYIHQHSRIDYNCEDSVLELYGNAAEETIMNLCSRTYEDFITTYGDIPTPVRQATLMLVDVSYQQRTPVSAQALYAVPYTFDLLIKPYMRLVGGSTSTSENMMQNVVLGSDFKLSLQVTNASGTPLSEIPFTVEVTNTNEKDTTVTISSTDCIVNDTTSTITAIINSDDLGIGLIQAKVTLQVPDEDYPNGVRRDVQRINPYTQIVG